MLDYLLDEDTRLASLFKFVRNIPEVLEKSCVSCLKFCLAIQISRLLLDRLLISN